MKRTQLITTADLSREEADFFVVTDGGSIEAGVGGKCPTKEAQEKIKGLHISRLSSKRTSR